MRLLTGRLRVDFASRRQYPPSPWGGSRLLSSSLPSHSPAWLTSRRSRISARQSWPWSSCLSGSWWLRQPAHPMGWLLLGVALFFLLDGDASSYSILDYRMHHGSLPLGAVAVLLQPSWAPAIALLGLTILLFPDGRLPSRRWRWVLWPYLALGPSG